MMLMKLIARHGRLLLLVLVAAGCCTLCACRILRYTGATADNGMSDEAHLTSLCFVDLLPAADGIRCLSRSHAYRHQRFGVFLFSRWGDVWRLVGRCRAGSGAPYGLQDRI